MSASTAIADVTYTLEELLKNEQNPQDLFDISLKSPAEETIVPSMKPKINLFLFRVAENINAKNQEWKNNEKDLAEIGWGRNQRPWGSQHPLGQERGGQIDFPKRMKFFLRGVSGGWRVFLLSRGSLTFAYSIKPFQKGPL